MFRPDRAPGRPVSRLGWRLRIFAMGACLAGAGIYLNQSWPIWLAIAVLLVGMAMRFLPTDREKRDPPSEPEDAGPE